ncbi:four-carbon acid sugar kinase family protein [Oleiharenicola lentus]|uniref:four-carbon acid sugar kinase family protein n=1 Tax=Oleiharenicola lentus TaxID=2508720 RepID=UPI003F673D3A
MNRLPLIVLADDLTGAAEIAAIAHAAGLQAVVHTSLPKSPVKADVIVFDTDTRLATPAQAAKRVREITKKLNRWPHDGFFKKTDSVLRGNVLAEIEACAAELQLARTLLVPCNPSLGRIINNGQYLISNVPLHKTNFARDPHHPRLTSDVQKLLSPGKNSALASHSPSERLPKTGIIIGEAASPADVALWASRVDKNTLPVGGADFFRNWLVRQRTPERHPTSTTLEAGNAVLLSGTATINDPLTPLPGTVLALSPEFIRSRVALFDEVGAELKATGFLSLHTGGHLAKAIGTPEMISRAFVRLAQDLHEASAFTHLIIAGGATAAAVLKALDWSELRVVRVWGPGVVTLQPSASSQVTITLKPGSYSWPNSISEHFHSDIFSNHA